MNVCRRSWMRGRCVRPWAVQPSRFLSPAEGLLHCGARERRDAIGLEKVL